MREYIVKQWKEKYIIWIIGLIMPSLFSLITQYMSARLGETIIKYVMRNNTFFMIIQTCSMIFLGYLISEVLWGVTKYCLNWLKIILECGMKERVFNKALRTEYIHMVGMDTGEVFLHYNSDVETIVSILTEDIYNILYSLVMGVGISVLIMKRNILVGALIFMLMVIVLLLHSYYARIFKDLESRERLAREQQIGGFSQIVTAKDMIRQMEIQEVIKSELEKRISSLLLIRQEGNRKQLQKTLRMDWFIYACATLILPISCIMASIGKINLYDTIFIVQLAGNIIWSTRSLGIAIIEFNKKGISVKAIEEMMNRPEDTNVETKQTTRTVDDENNDIILEFNQVSIKYPNYQPISNLNFQCKKGTITLIMGQSGAGKSSILHGILGFASHTGKIRIGDDIVTKENIRKIRDTVAYVSEHCEFDDGKIGENIKLGNESIDDEKIMEYLIRFRLEDLGEGVQGSLLDIACGTRGENLSGGQKQRLSIIRAMVKGCDIMLLDEPTASLDKETEELVLKELCNLRDKGKTIIMVTHRGSSKKIADQILEIE